MAWIEQVGDNTWKVSWRTGGRDTTKQSARFTGTAGARRATLAKQLVEDRRGDITSAAVYDAILNPGAEPVEQASDAPTLREWVEQWMPSRTRPSPGTLEGYWGMWNRKILPAFGDRHMDHITGVDVGALLNQLRAAGLRETTITRYFSELHAAYAAAIKAHRTSHVTTNPCDEVDFVRDGVAHDDAGDDAEEAVYLTPDQYRRLRAEFAPHYHPLLDFLVGTGARWSEGTAVAVEQVEMTPKHGLPPQVHIIRAWKKGKRGRRYLGSTKGKRRRTVPIPGWLAPVVKVQLPAAVETFEQWKKEQHRRKVKVEHKAPFLLTTPSGAPYDYANFYHQVWVPAVVRAMRCPGHPPPDRGGPVPEGATPGSRCRDHGGTRGDGGPCGRKLARGMTRCRPHMGPEPGAVSTCNCPTRLRERPTPHDLRHSFASWYLAGGGTIRELQELLGHESVTTTEIYSGLQPGSEQRTTAALDAVWNGTV